MDPSAREQLEEQIRELCARGDLAAAATAGLKGYGPEIFGFLVTSLRDADVAGEVFSAFSERLWGALESFAWQCSFRTWAFTIARNESMRYLRDSGRRNRRQVPLATSMASAIAGEVRAATLPHLKTEAKSKMARLRAELAPEDSALLTLRVDKELEWPDVARILHEGDGNALDADALKREAARLRKRFQLLKDRLLELGRREGLLPEDGS